MPSTKMTTIAGLAVATFIVSACSHDGGLTTASLSQPTTKIAEPGCTQLVAKIEAVRQEGTPAKVYAVANGKTRSATIKRAALAKAAELDQLNQEFQSKCSKIPRQQTASAPAAQPTLPHTTSPQVAPTQSAISTSAIPTQAQQAAQATTDTTAQVAKTTREIADRAVIAPNTPIVAVPPQQ